MLLRYIYTGILATDCKIGDKVVVVDGDNLYPLRIWAIEQFNKSLQEGATGLEIGLVFRNSELPKTNVKIYKAE